MILEAKGLSHVYPGGVPALDGLDLRVQTRRKLAILGPNGAGKTTLLLHLNGTLRPSAGQVMVKGSAASYTRPALASWRTRVSLVMQEPDDQLFAATVAEDVAYGPRNLNLSEAEVTERVRDALDALDLAPLAGRPPHMLSFGQKKRAALAGALAMRPEVLLLDEPLAGLDRKASRQLLAALDTLARSGTTLVFTTHDVDLAWDFAEDVALFDSGRVIRHGGAEEVLADTHALAQAGLEPPLLQELGYRTREEARRLRLNGPA